MKKTNLKDLFALLASPVLLLLLGLLLLVHPDSASALIARILGWCVFLAGVCFGVTALAKPGNTLGKVLAAIACLGLGGWLIRNPLVLAAGIGRVLGAVLLIRGVQDLFQSAGKLWGLVTALVGLVLVVLPMTTSRLVFSLCGAAMMVIGAVMLLDRLRTRRLDSGDNDPNIIDAL